MRVEQAHTERCVIETRKTRRRKNEEWKSPESAINQRIDSKSIECVLDYETLSRRNALQALDLILCEAYRCAHAKSHYRFIVFEDYN